jgi:predicted dehydrogenase
MSKQNLTRRNFIGLTGIAGVGLVLSGRPLMAAHSFDTKAYTGRVFKMGVIGCGSRSGAIIDALNSVQEIEMAAFCDIVPHKMGKRAELIKNGAKPKFVNSVDELLKMPELDCVAIITPNYTHRDIAVAAFQAGKHVWVEKPLAMTVVECNDIIGAAERAQKALQIGHQRRHAAGYKALVDIIRKKPLGKVLQSSLYDYRGDWRVPEADEYPAGTGYWRLNQQQSGGVVYEMGAHIIDVNNWVLDSEPVSVCSMQGVNNFTLRKRDSSDHAGVLVQYANGSVMNYGSNTYNYGSMALNTFFCEHGTVQMGNGMIAIKYGSPAGFPVPDDLPQPEEIRPPGGVASEIEQLRHFAKVMDGKEKAYPDGYAARQCVQIMQGSLLSAIQRRVIDVRELG